MRVVFLNPETYVDWQQESWNHDVRLPMLESGAVTEHHDVCYPRLLRQHGRAAMQAEVLATVRRVQPDAVVHGVTWPHENLEPCVTQRMLEEGIPVFTQTFDVPLQLGPVELEQLFACSILGVCDSVSQTHRLRALLGHGLGPRAVLFTAGNNDFATLLPPAPAERVHDVVLLGSLEGQRVALIDALRARLAPHGITLTKAGGLVDSRRGRPEDGLSDGWVAWDDYAAILARTRIALCSQTQPTRSQLKGKVFHYLAAGVLCLSDPNSEVRALVPDGCLVYYDGPDDCAAKIRHYLAHPDERERIAAAGRIWLASTFDRRTYWATLLRALVHRGPLPSDPPFRHGPDLPAALDASGARAVRAEAVRVASGDVCTTDALAHLALANGEPQVAMAQLQRVVGAMPLSAPLLIRLAEASLGAGHRPQAEQLVAAAQSLAPESPLVRRITGAPPPSPAMPEAHPGDDAHPFRRRVTRVARNGIVLSEDRWLVTAVVSAYRSERFMRGLLEDLLGQTIAERTEIIVCDSASPENEAAIVREFQQRYDNIVYLRTPEREPSQASFNRCLAVARGRYCTMANTDDRHRPDALEVLARALDAAPGAGLAYGDILVTRHENETWSRNTADRVIRYPPWSLRQSLMFCHFGPQAMWRTRLGDDVDWFDEDLSFANDFDRYVDLAWKHGALHVPEVLGLYYEGGFEGQNQPKVAAESQRVIERLRRRIPLEDVYPALRDPRWQDDPRARLAALLDYGVALLGPPWPDRALALECFLLALEIAPVHAGALGNVALLRCLGGDARGGPLLEHLAASGDALASANLAALRHQGDGRRVSFLTVPHPVVTALAPLWRPGDCFRPWRQTAPGASALRQPDAEAANSSCSR